MKLSQSNIKSAAAMLFGLGAGSVATSVLATGVSPVVSLLTFVYGMMLIAGALSLTQPEVLEHYEQ